MGNTCPAFYSNGGAGVCSNGACTTTCASGYQFDGSTAPGQCKATSNDPNNCGSLGNKCVYANGVGSCVGGQCSLSSCTAPYIKYNGACVNTNTDSNNCGSGGNQCNFGLGSGSCVNGKCVAKTCGTGFKLLDGICTVISYQTDPKNCGGGGIQCPSLVANALDGSASALCVLGKCVAKCALGFDWDQAYLICRDVRSDNNNCGACGKPCVLPGATGTKCVDSQCQATGCSSGYALKSGVCVAVDTNTDPNNCGSPNPVKCPSSYVNGGAGVCQAGKCTTTCNSGYTWSGTGCVSINTPDNCGALNQKCQVSNGVG